MLSDDVKLGYPARISSLKTRFQQPNSYCTIFIAITKLLSSKNKENTFKLKLRRKNRNLIKRPWMISILVIKNLAHYNQFLNEFKEVR